MMLRPLTTEHSNVLIDKIKNFKLYKDDIIEDIKYTMKVSMNKDECLATFTSGQEAGYKNSVIYEGFLNHSNIF